MQANDGQHATWIAGRVQTLLSHYFQPNDPAEVREAALDDWVSALIPFSRQEIEDACQNYLRSSTTRRPLPADIRNRISARREAGVRKKNPGNDRLASLSLDERQIVIERIIPTAERWLNIPGLRDKGESTLRYWGVIQ